MMILQFHLTPLKDPWKTHYNVLILMIIILVFALLLKMQEYIFNGYIMYFYLGDTF